MSGILCNAIRRAGSEVLSSVKPPGLKTVNPCLKVQEAQRGCRQLQQGFRQFSSNRIPETFKPPQEIKKLPMDALFVINRSPNARNTTVEQIRGMGGSWAKQLTIVEARQDGRPITPSSNLPLDFYGPASWDDFEKMSRSLDNFFLKNPSFNNSKNAVYYPWCEQAESPEHARFWESKGFHWVGISADVLERQTKANFKKTCIDLGIPTSPFIELGLNTAEKSSKDPDLIRKAADHFTKELLDNAPPVFFEEGCFVKLDGGGGRGSRGIDAETMKDQAAITEAINAIINENNGSWDGLYAEGLVGAEGLLKQYEFEVQGTRNIGQPLADKLLSPDTDSCRILNQSTASVREVAFTNRKKVIEQSYTEAQALHMYGEEVLELKKQARVLADALGNDNRATVEVLKAGKNISFLELNARIQVEHMADAILSMLKGEKGIYPVVVPGLQIMASYGFPAPNPDQDYEPIPGKEFSLHVRLVNSDLDSDGNLIYKTGTVEGAHLPYADEIFLNKGDIHSDSDPQFGCAVYTAPTHEEVTTKAARSLMEGSVYGKGIDGNWLPNLPRLLSDERHVGLKEFDANDPIKIMNDKGEDN